MDSNRGPLCQLSHHHSPPFLIFYLQLDVTGIQTPAAGFEGRLKGQTLAMAKMTFKVCAAVAVSLKCIFCFQWGNKRHRKPRPL